MANLLDRLPRWAHASISLGLVLVVGSVDYLSGHEALFSTFYLLAVALAAWRVGPAFAAVVSVLSVGAWLAGDKAAGAVYSNPFVPAWNALIVLAFYLVVVWLLRGLRHAQRELEARVRQRTQALTEEMVDKQRLESELLESGESERRRLGHDLHDSLGQHLTGTALAAQLLAEKLREHSVAEAEEAARIVSLVEEGIELTRSVARGLDPVEVERGGLAEGLRRLAVSTSERFGMKCDFEGEPDVNVRNIAAAIHLYRIAQEAISNALRHGRAGHVLVRLHRQGASVRLEILDDGTAGGDFSGKGQGMGLRIMAHRAAMIGGAFRVGREGGHGTAVVCEWREP